MKIKYPKEITFDFVDGVFLIFIIFQILFILSIGENQLYLSGVILFSYTTYFIFKNINGVD